MSAKHEELQPQEPVADESVRVPSPDGPNKLRERSNGSRCRFAWASELSAPSGLNRGKLRGRPAFYDFMSSAGRIVALRKSVQLPRFAPTPFYFVVFRPIIAAGEVRPVIFENLPVSKANRLLPV